MASPLTAAAGEEAIQGASSSPDQEGPAPGIPGMAGSLPGAPVDGAGEAVVPSAGSVRPAGLRDSVNLFRTDLEARFVERPNRFVVIAEDARGRKFRCHMPNPGRMTELLVPGTPLLLQARTPPSGADRRDSPRGEEGAPRPAETVAGPITEEAAEAGRAAGPPSPRKTEWTAVAARYRGGIVPLVSASMNRVARDLVLPRLYPQATELRGEYAVGTSRFDFLVTDRHDQRTLVEVKSCSLVEFGVAMFPDAPSERALRHLRELSRLADEGYRAAVIFVIGHGRAERLVPNLHTDPAFAAELSAAAANVDIRAVQLEVREDGLARLVRQEVPVDLSYGALAAANRGSYLILLELREAATMGVGALGPVHFEPGWYVYCGSAERGLSSRTARHLRTEGKRLRWHIDYLVPAAARLEAFPIAGRENLECCLSAALAALGGIPVPRFGSSDCVSRCGSHLYRFGTPPLKDRAFLDLLFRFRHEVALR